MSYHINFILEEDHLHARVEGDNTPKDVANYMTEIQNRCSQYKCRKVLIEENLTGPTISTFDIFKIVDQASQNVPSTVQKIAYVDMNAQHDHEAMHFAETVALNRGVNIKLFTNLQLAREWLDANI
jgi:hypothetical protein